MAGPHDKTASRLVGSAPTAAAYCRSRKCENHGIDQNRGHDGTASGVTTLLIARGEFRRAHRFGARGSRMRVAGSIQCGSFFWVRAAGVVLALFAASFISFPSFPLGMFTSESPVGEPRAEE